MQFINFEPLRVTNVHSWPLKVLEEFAQAFPNAQPRKVHAPNSSTAKVVAPKAKNPMRLKRVIVLDDSQI